MRKKIILFFFCSLFCLTSFAVKASVGYSTVSFTNNSDQPIEVSSTLLTSDTNFKKGKDWDELTAALAPYETKNVLWFSRYKNVKKNATYHFELLVKHIKYPGYNVKFAFNQIGNAIVGSKITADLTLPERETIQLFNPNHFEKHEGNFWNNQFTIFARNFLPTGNVYNSYHFVLDKPQQTSFATNSNQQISVLTYNVQLQPFYTGVVNHLNHPDMRVQEIPPLIKNYDVVIFEELFDRDLRQKMTDAMQSQYPYHTEVVNKSSPKIMWTGGVMVFSKWPIVKENQIVYRNSTGIDALAAKGAMYAAINKKGQMYHIFGTHLQAGQKAEERSAREKQIQEMAEFIRCLNIPFAEPILMGGDFNTDEFTKDIDYLLTTLNVELVGNIGYRYSSDSNINTMSANNGRSRIDFVFYDKAHRQPKIAINKVFIVRALKNEKMYPTFDLSDHFPVVSYFDFSI